jgi:hypothetical protein
MEQTITAAAHGRRATAGLTCGVAAGQRAAGSTSMTDENGAGTLDLGVGQGPVPVKCSWTAP